MLDHTKLWLGQNSWRSSIDDHDEKEERELSWAWVQKTIIIVLGDRIKLRFKLRQIKSGVPDTVIPIRSTMPFRSVMVCETGK